MLQQLAELAMDAAVVARQRIVDQAERERGAAPDPTGASDRIAGNLQLDFSRAAQAVRQTLALQEKIEQDERLRHDRQAAEAAQRRAAERQANIERRKARIQQDLERVIKAKLPPAQTHPLINNLNTRLKPERLDWDFGDAPLREIFLRICRNIGVPESWSQQWDDEPDPADEAAAEAVAPIPGAAPANDARSHKTEAQGAADPRQPAETRCPPLATGSDPP